MPFNPLQQLHRRIGLEEDEEAAPCLWRGMTTNPTFFAKPL